MVARSVARSTTKPVARQVTKPGGKVAPVIPGTDEYLRPGGVDKYRRPGGTDLYKRPA